MIGKIKRLPLREVWKHEAYDFTKWLEDNIDVLNEILNLSLCDLEREKSAGIFSVDLVAEDENGNLVIIENQLEKSNHDHLGKIITYLTALDAKKAIWIVSDPRPEHIKAISWLNESYSADFYFLKVEAIQIDDSLPAPLLTLITGPSEESKNVGEIKEERAERYNIRFRFWTGLLDRAREKTKLHSNISPGQNSWIGTGIGVNGNDEPYIIRTHMEDDKGAAIQVKMQVGQIITMAKLVGTEPLLLSTGKIIDNPESDRGCRTKITTQVADADKLLHQYSYGLHRVIFYGDHTHDVERLSKLLGFKVVYEI